MTIQTEILSQLSEIQRTLGTVVGTVEGLKEEVKSQGVETSEYRETITSGLNNALTRIAALEEEIRGVKTTIEKTLKPLATGAINMKQRMLGFISAWGMVVTLAGGALWLLSVAWEPLMRAIVNITKAPVP